MKILIVGTNNQFCLETSYSSAATKLGHEVIRFDPSKEIFKFIKFGKFGKKFHEFIPVNAWNQKMNRKLIILVKDTNPDLVLFFGNTNINAGCLATIKTIRPKLPLVWVWPDTPFNLNQYPINCAKLYDLSAIYSKTAIAPFDKLGFNNTLWLPLAGDLNMHFLPVDENQDFKTDISFVGMWRPEREKVMKAIIEAFPNLKIEIHGVYWERDCKDKTVLQRLTGKGFYAKDLAVFFNSSRVNINIIDDTNYPAANMRFFEIPTAGGLQLCSSCPEQESEFSEKNQILYFKDNIELIDQISWVFSNQNDCLKIRQNSQSKVLSKHNYEYRLETIINALENI